MRLFLLLPGLLTVSQPALAAFHFQFDETARQWTLSNGIAQAVFELSGQGRFEFVSLDVPGSGDGWRRSAEGASSVVRFRVGNQWWDERTTYRLVAHAAGPIPRGGYRQTIVLDETRGNGQVTVELEMYEGQPVLRYGARYRNLGQQTVYITGADMLHWDLHDEGASYRAMRVEQWMPVANPADFERQIVAIDPAGRRFPIDSGAHGRHCGWLALADPNGRGLVAGWEFNGKTAASVYHWEDQGRVLLAAILNGVYHPVEPGQEFQVPRAFLGVFHGDWDQAGFVTQRFTEKALARQTPDGIDFPFVSWDSWAYGQDIDGETLRRNAEIAARLGIELFVVDLGWSLRIGDWREDRSKFPSGLRALSDYVRSLGMKFGLHFAFAEAAPDAPVLERDQDWRSSSTYGYYGAESLCLSNRPTRDWIIAQAVRMIDDYKVDWILQDGENMVKECTKTTHTHHPLDSNYSNAVHGLDYVLAEIQRLRPHVMWENCENGGNLMTFQMVQNYVTSIVNDASGARGSRQAVFGATYPFPPRYTDRYMPEQELSSYVTRSYMFGGPWIFMNKLTEMKPHELDYAAAEIARFKQVRRRIAEGKVLHLTAAPAQGRIDAIASFHPETDTAVAVVTRDGSAGQSYRLRIRELDKARSYRVFFADDARTLTFTGAQLAQDGVVVRLPQSQSSEIVYVEPLR